MPLGERRVKQLTAGGLIGAVLLTRLPLATKMLYEFDSIDFAVATFRYSLEQVTPHFPGYILHILFAKFLLLFTSDVNQAFVWISVLLSIGSVLYLWRAAAALRGERVGLIAAVIWLFLPIFWFYGLVATVYEYEAFFACAFLYHGITLLRNADDRKQFFWLCILLSLSTGARQSSIVFFAPAILFIALVTRQRFKTVAIGFGLFVIVTAAWLSILFVLCGGVDVYFNAMRSEHIYQSQSILFGNGLKEHLAIMTKVIFYLLGGGLPLLLVFITAILLYPKRLFVFIKDIRSKVSVQYISLIALPPLIFYLAIYFMKAGYLLNVLPSMAIASAVLIDQLALWRAEAIKTKEGNALLLTRPIITKGAIFWTGIVVAFEMLWFTIRFPVTSDAEFFNAFTADSFGGLQRILDRPNRGFGYAVNRLLSFSSYHSAFESDLLHQTIRDTLRAELKKNPNLILLDTWWHRWGYYYLPEATIYDIRSYDIDGILKVGKAKEFVRQPIYTGSILVPQRSEVLLLIRKDHPSFEELRKQVDLEALPLPNYLDIWRVKDSTFRLQWLDKQFVKQ